MHRFEQMANEMLANSTVAGQEGTLGNLVASAALQQFGQAALALLVLHRADRPLSAEGLEQEAENLLQHHFQVGPQFDVSRGSSCVKEADCFDTDVQVSLRNVSAIITHIKSAMAASDRVYQPGACPRLVEVCCTFKQPQTGDAASGLLK